MSKTSQVQRARPRWVIEVGRLAPDAIEIDGQQQQLPNLADGEARLSWALDKVNQEIADKPSGAGSATLSIIDWRAGGYGTQTFQLPSHSRIHMNDVRGGGLDTATQVPAAAAPPWRAETTQPPRPPVTPPSPQPESATGSFAQPSTDQVPSTSQQDDERTRPTLDVSTGTMDGDAPSDETAHTETEIAPQHGTHAVSPPCEQDTHAAANDLAPDEPTKVIPPEKQPNAPTTQTTHRQYTTQQVHTAADPQAPTKQTRATPAFSTVEEGTTRSITPLSPQTHGTDRLLPTSPTSQHDRTQGPVSATRVPPADDRQSTGVSAANAATVQQARVAIQATPPSTEEDKRRLQAKIQKVRKIRERRAQNEAQRKRSKRIRATVIATGCLAAATATILIEESPLNSGYVAVCVDHRTQARVDDTQCANISDQWHHWWYIPDGKPVARVGSEVPAHSAATPDKPDSSNIQYGFNPDGAG